MIINLKTLASYFILLLLAFSCNNKVESGMVMNLTCDVEAVEKAKGQVLLKSSGDYLLTGANNRSEEKAHSGKYSIKLGHDNKYGFQVKFSDLKKDMFVRATVWIYGDVGHLAFTSSKPLNYHAYSKSVVQSDENGWKQIILEAFVPPHYDGEEIKLFVMNQEETDVYFDDLEVSVYNTKPYPEYKDIDNIELLIDQEYLDEINENRIKSFKKGVITNKTKKTYPAIFKYGTKELKAKVRIKGDWLDHIQGNKLSFRIKLIDGNFKGMQEFSIQQPHSRGMINEYVIHKIFEEEDILTTQYGFVPVKINGESKGIFAFEEHFAKHIIESRDRREGPILKFSEKALWVILQKNQLIKEDYIKAPYVESATITPFKKGKTSRNPTLKGNFMIGQNLLRQYQYDSSPVSELFKIDKLSKFYAITDITRAWHSTRWHNERYYYDPVSSKLEIIAYDCFTTSGPDKSGFDFSPRIIELRQDFIYDNYLKNSPFNDPQFNKEYIKAVDDYLFSDKLSATIDKYLEDINFNIALLQKEYSYYNYDPYSLLKGIEELSDKWVDLKPKLKNGDIHANLVLENYNYENLAPIDGMSLQAYLESSNEIKVTNFHAQKLYLISYSNKKLPEQGIVAFEEPIEFNSYNGLSTVDSKSVICSFTPTKIYFKSDLISDEIFTTKVATWPEPTLSSPRQTLLSSSIEKSNQILLIEDSVYKFRKGKHLITSPLIIPAGKTVIIEEGVHLDFVNKAFFMSFSPINIKGEINNPVIIESSDGSAMGFTTIDAEKASIIDQVIFRGFNTLAYQGWNLTGAVTFYESDITITNTQFLENNCEDALNIIRSDFSMKKSTISDAYADGFDADFATGIVENCVFERIGNDGIDFSGSTIEIVDVIINNIGDKGISGGESSTLQLKNITISNATIGVASKDRSLVNINGIKISDSYCAFAVYQKKTAYEAAKMYVENCELNAIEREDLLGLGSIIMIDGNEYQGKERINIDSLYGL